MIGLIYLKKHINPKIKCWYSNVNLTKLTTFYFVTEQYV